MHPGVIGHVLAQIVDADIHQLDRIERGSAKFGRSGGMGGAAVKGEVDPGIGQRIGLEHAGIIGRVPADRGIDIGEKPGAHHEGLGGPPLFGRAAVIAHPPRGSGRGQPVAQGHRRQHRRRAEKVVAATMAEAAQRAFLGQPRFLAQFRQRVIFAEDGDHRPACAPFAHHRGRDAGEVAADPRALGGKLIEMRRGRAGFGIGDLGRVEDPVGQCHVIRAPRLDHVPERIGVLHRIPHSAHRLSRAAAAPAPRSGETPARSPRRSPCRPAPAAGAVHRR